MEIVAGLSLKNLQPSVWEHASPYHLPLLGAIMVSYADFHQTPARMQKAREMGLRGYLGVPRDVRVYLDNGAFYFLRKKGKAERKLYERFVREAEPDWWPIPFDAIPTPKMSLAAQRRCLNQTMEVNLAYQHDGFVPVIHVCRLLNEYVEELRAHPKLSKKAGIALGGIVPNLLRSQNALSFDEILRGLRHVRDIFQGKDVHVFGIGGTATLHVAALLGIDSIDSSGWRNRAARGLIQMPGSGERMVANLGKWRGRVPTEEEWAVISRCRCPACRRDGLDGLKTDGIAGFCCRAVHNLHVLLEEARWVKKHIAAGSYAKNFRRRLDNSTYLPLVASFAGHEGFDADEVAEERTGCQGKTRSTGRR